MRNLGFIVEVCPLNHLAFRVVAAWADTLVDFEYFAFIRSTIPEQRAVRLVMDRGRDANLCGSIARS